MNRARREPASAREGELFRSLAVVCEPTRNGAEVVIEALGLGGVPSAFSYTDLFEFQLYPYASVYLGVEGMLGGEARDRIAGFWRVLGETPVAEPDHLAVLLAAYAELADREGDAPDDEARSRWRHARGAFFWEHLASWLPVYLGRVAELDEGFYAKWSELLRMALTEEAKRFSAPELLPLHLREAEPLGDAAEMAGEEFLRALIAPVRTGCILTRSDLERCARDLELGSRKGERGFVLKSLLGQAPKEALGWLAAEARRQAKLLRGWPEAFAPITGFWNERAMATARFLDETAGALDD